MLVLCIEYLQKFRFTSISGSRAGSVAVSGYVKVQITVILRFYNLGSSILD
jgi:hypothetical protein